MSALSILPRASSPPRSRCGPVAGDLALLVTPQRRRPLNLSHPSESKVTEGLHCYPLSNHPALTFRYESDEACEGTEASDDEGDDESCL